jgi:hypothetical protein
VTDLPGSNFLKRFRSVFLSRSDIAVEKEDKSLYIRALALEAQDSLFAVEESGTTYEINLSTSDSPDQNVVISSIPGSFWFRRSAHGRSLPSISCGR